MINIEEDKLFIIFKSNEQYKMQYKNSLQQYKIIFLTAFSLIYQDHILFHFFILHN